MLTPHATDASPPLMRPVISFSRVFVLAYLALQFPVCLGQSLVLNSSVFLSRHGADWKRVWACKSSQSSFDVEEIPVDASQVMICSFNDNNNCIISEINAFPVELLKTNKSLTANGYYNYNWWFVPLGSNPNLLLSVLMDQSQCYGKQYDASMMYCSCGRCLMLGTGQCSWDINNVNAYNSSQGIEVFVNSNGYVQDPLPVRIKFNATSFKRVNDTNWIRVWACDSSMFVFDLGANTSIYMASQVMIYSFNSTTNCVISKSATRPGPVDRLKASRSLTSSGVDGQSYWLSTGNDALLQGLDLAPGHSLNHDMMYHAGGNEKGLELGSPGLANELEYQLGRFVNGFLPFRCTWDNSGVNNFEAFRGIEVFVDNIKPISSSLLTIFGGGGPAVSSVYQLDGQVWIPATPMLTARSAFGIAVLRGALYAVGGDTLPMTGTVLSSVEKYNGTHWEYAASLDTAGRTAFAICYCNF